MLPEKITDEICLATQNDIAELVALINSVYRGKSALLSWTNEADIIEGGIRVDDDDLKNLITKPKSWLLVYREKSNKILGCVNLQLNETRLYLGLLSVDNSAQKKGIGKKLMQAADLIAEQNNCTAVYMQVVYLRDKLIEWYEKQCYRKTGKELPWNIPEKYGKPKVPIYFLELEKKLIH